MTAPRDQTSSSTLLACLALFSAHAAAQPAPAPAATAERVIAISGAADEAPLVLYAAPDVPLVVSFDAPLKKDVVVTVPGADVRPHPFMPSALVITPSKSLAAQSSVPLLVPMAEGAVPLTLAFSPARADIRVRIVHRIIFGAPAATQDELQELVTFVARTALDPKACPSADATDVPRQVAQPSSVAEAGRVCGGGALAYVSVTAPAGCKPAKAALTGGNESADVLLFQQTMTEWCSKEKSCWLVVARTPRGDGHGFTLELLAGDGAVCQSAPVDLKP